MALVGSRVELDADEVRGQAEGAGPGAGGVGGMRRPAGSRLAGRDGRLSFTPGSVPRGRAAQPGAGPSLPGSSGYFAGPF